MVKWGRRRLDKPGVGCPGTCMQVERLGKSGFLLTLRCEVVLTFRGTEKLLMPSFQEKLLAYTYRKTVPETDTGGQVEYTEAHERTRVKELGKMVP